MLLVNNERPDQIFVNDAEIFMVLIGNLGYWGKAYMVNAETYTDAIITMEKIYSPHENTELGPFASGTIAYHGDIIKVSVSVEPNREVEEVYVNGEKIYTEIFSVTKDCAVTCKIVDKVVVLPTWKTIFSGNFESFHGTSSAYTTKSRGIPNYQENCETRICFRLMIEGSSTPIITETNRVFYHENDYFEYYYKNKRQTIGFVRYGSIEFGLQRPTPTFFNKPLYWVITKIEQFY